MKCLCWVLCNAQRKQLAADIVANHFADGASDPVNVDGIYRHYVLDNLADAAVELFDVTQTHVSLAISLMQYMFWHLMICSRAVDGPEFLGPARPVQAFSPARPVE